MLAIWYIFLQKCFAETIPVYIVIFIYINCDIPTALLKFL